MIATIYVVNSSIFGCYAIDRRRAAGCDKGPIGAWLILEARGLERVSRNDEGGGVRANKSQAHLIKLARARAFPIISAIVSWLILRNELDLPARSGLIGG